ncbi:MAG: DNA repair protein RecO [Microgenomates group bacterium]
MNYLYKTQGIILKRKNYGEIDRILTIFTLNYGKIKVLAKGVRKITSKRAGNLETFNFCRFLIRKGKTFDILSEVEVLDNFSSWRKNINKVKLAYYFCELVDKFTPEGEKNEKIFNLLKNSLKLLEKNEEEKLKKEFEEKILLFSGFGIPPQLKDKGNLISYIEKIIERKINTFRTFS